MTNSATVRDSDGVCPSCSTRLRISLETADKSQFGCPECGVAVVADQQSDGTIQISKFSAILSEASSHGVDLPRSVRQLPGGSRTIAAAVTLIVGILLLIFLIPGSTDPQQAEAGPDSAAGERHDDGDVVPSDAESSTLIANSADPSINDKLDEQKLHLIEAPVDFSHADVVPDWIPAAGGKAVSVASGTETAANHTTKITRAAGEQTRDPDVAEIVTPAPAALPALPEQATAKPMSVRERLDISIRTFRQIDPTPFRDVIRIVEQMCLVRVDISAASSEQLDKEVTVSLEQTTPADILAEAGRKSGLRVIVEGASVRIVSAPK